jgi:hypothetical protein
MNNQVKYLVTTMDYRQEPIAVDVLYCGRDQTKAKKAIRKAKQVVRVVISLNGLIISMRDYRP